MDDPARAGPLPGALDVLGRLVERFGAVGVISGRPVAYLLDHLGAVDGLILSGLYGLERAVAGGDGIEVDPDAARYRPMVTDVADRAEAQAPAGIYVERKGLSVGLHVREAPQHAVWIERFAAAESARTGLRPHPGKLSVELRPPIEVDKGVVLDRLARGLHAVAYFGDDLGDLPAFAALGALRGRGVVTRALAVAGADAPAEVLAAADEIIAGPPEVLRVLEVLAGPAR